MKPESVSLIQLGGVSTRQVALMAGQIQATVLSDPQATAATQGGMKLWVDLSESKWGLPRMGLYCFMAKRSFLDSNREAAGNFLKAVIEGLYLLKDKPLGVRLIKKYLRLNDEAASIGYDFDIGKHGEGMLSLPERRGMEFIIAEVAKANPAASKATPESLRLVEPSFLDEIKKERVCRTRALKSRQTAILIYTDGGKRSYFDVFIRSAVYYFSIPRIC